MQSHTYTSATICAFARVMKLPREVVWMIIRHVDQPSLYLLIQACVCRPASMLTNSDAINSILKRIACNYSARGYIDGLTWMHNLGYRVGYAGDPAIANDDLSTLQWLEKHKWVMITGGWMDTAWKAGAIKCATWLRARLRAYGLHPQLDRIDFTQPYYYVWNPYGITELV